MRRRALRFQPDVALHRFLGRVFGRFVGARDEPAPLVPGE